MEVDDKMELLVDCVPDVLLNLEVSAICAVAVVIRICPVDVLLFVGDCFDTDILVRGLVEEREPKDSFVGKGTVKLVDG